MFFSTSATSSGTVGLGRADQRAPALWPIPRHLMTAQNGRSLGPQFQTHGSIHVSQNDIVSNIDTS
jgi:hypothetical protein